MSIVMMKKNTDPDRFLDITHEICPLTFVKTKLLLERMVDGEIVEIRLKGKEPLENIPRSVMDAGHAILTVEELPNSGGIHKMIVRKSR